MCPVIILRNTTCINAIIMYSSPAAQSKASCGLPLRLVAYTILCKKYCFHSLQLLLYWYVCFCPRLLHDVTSPVFLRHFGRRLTWLQAEEECQRHYGHLVRGKSKRRLLLASTREINARLSLAPLPSSRPHTTVSKKASSPLQLFVTLLSAP